MFREDYRLTEAVPARDPLRPNTPQQIRLADTLIAEAEVNERRLIELEKVIGPIDVECRSLRWSIRDKRAAATKILTGQLPKYL